MTKKVHFDTTKIEWLPIKKLSVVWQQSQRKLNEAHADKIADNFDPELFGTLVVTKPNGHGIYHVIDGHHRKVAVEKIWGGEEMVPCHVLDAENPARAAELFDKLNSARKAIQPLDLFLVRVTAKSETEVAINNIVKSAGYHIGTHYTKTKGDGTSDNIVCVAALKSVFLTHGPEVLENTLKIIRATWGSDDPRATDAQIIRGFGEFLAEFRSLDWKRLREAVESKFTPIRLLVRAKQHRDMHGGTVSSAIKDELLFAYNSGLRGSKKLSKESSRAKEEK